MTVQHIVAAAEVPADGSCCRADTDSSRPDVTYHNWNCPHVRDLTLVPGQHIWIGFNGSGYGSCRWCGMIRRRDDQNPDCRGIVHIGLRDVAENHYPTSDRTEQEAHHE